MTIQDLGQKVKDKYQQYVQYPVEELGRKVIEKYPEYKSKLDQSIQVMNDIGERYGQQEKMGYLLTGGSGNVAGKVKDFLQAKNLPGQTLAQTFSNLRTSDPQYQTNVKMSMGAPISETEKQGTRDSALQFAVGTTEPLKMPGFKGLNSAIKKADPLEALQTEARKYKSAEEFIDKNTFRDAHAAPRFDDTPVTKRMEDGGDYNLLEVVKGQHNQPSDYFDPRLGPRYYMYDDIAGMESLTAINNVKRGAKTITAYRVVPNEVKATKLIDGDWISFSKEYAKNHGESRFGQGEYKLIKQEVPAKNVWWDGNDIREWGYDTGKTKTYSRSELANIFNKAHAEGDTELSHLYTQATAPKKQGK